jgi:hypothetical protein
MFYSDGTLCLKNLFYVPKDGDVADLSGLSGRGSPDALDTSQISERTGVIEP